MNAAAGPNEKTQLTAGAGGKPRPKNPLKSRDFWLMILVPLIFFIGIELTYTYFFYDKPYVCILVSFFSLVGCGVILAQPKTGPSQAVGMLSIAAVCAGTFCGLYCYDTFGIFSFFYSNSRKYTNVVPSMPSAAVSDAGRISFTDETSVDTTKAVGYAAENGNVYCAAPVHDATDTPRVEYWAVGVNCCAYEAEFNCDGSADTSAHAGIVVFDNNGWFSESNKDYYNKARQKAEANFDLASVEKPIYLRFVNEGNLMKLSKSYSSKATAFILLSGLAATILLGVLARQMYVMGI